MNLFFGSFIALALLLLAHRRYKANRRHESGSTVNFFVGTPDEHPLDPNGVDEDQYPSHPEDIEIEKVESWLGTDVRDLPVEFLLDRPEQDDHPRMAESVPMQFRGCISQPTILHDARHNGHATSRSFTVLAVDASGNALVRKGFVDHYLDADGDSLEIVPATDAFALVADYRRTCIESSPAQ